MTKTLFTYLFILCVLLLGGYYSPLSAEVESALSAPKGEECLKSGFANYEQTTIAASSPSDANKLLDLVALEIEVEEEESFSSKKLLKVSNNFAHLFNTPFSGYFYHIFKRCYPYGQHFSNFRPDRLYLILEVFRL